MGAARRLKYECPLRKQTNKMRSVPNEQRRQLGRRADFEMTIDGFDVITDNHWTDRWILKLCETVYLCATVLKLRYLTHFSLLTARYQLDAQRVG